MEKFRKQLINIKPGIDRINISVPQQYSGSLLHWINQHYQPIKEEGVSPKYWNIYYRINNTDVTVTTPRHDDKNKHGYERTYLTLYDPTPETQQTLKDILRLATAGNLTGLNAPIVNAIEVCFDFFTENPDNLIDIKRYVEHHFVMKYLRYGASATFFGEDDDGNRIFNPENSTHYVGKKGDIRKASKGSRGYIKTENGQTFYRWEMQLNRPFIKNKRINCYDIPFTPLQFQIFDYVDILSDFTGTGVRNIARTFLRKQGVVEDNTPEFNTLHRVMVEEIRAEILGGSRGRTPRVTNQIDRSKDVKEDYGITFNHKQYFPELHADKQLITCHADIGYDEENCSKRLMWCQGN